MSPTITLAELNAADQATFVAAIGHCFEHSPWVAQATWPQRPFASLATLHTALCQTLAQADESRQLALIRAHPDLAGKLARIGELGAASTDEQRAAGLDALSVEEAAVFDQQNAAYWARFAFPFVICARENKKATILNAFAIRLANDRETEVATALAEIGKIAWLRLADTVNEQGSADYMEDSP